MDTTPEILLVGSEESVLLSLKKVAGFEKGLPVARVEGVYSMESALSRLNQDNGLGVCALFISSKQNPVALKEFAQSARRTRHGQFISVFLIVEDNQAQPPAGIYEIFDFIQGILCEPFSRKALEEVVALSTLTRLHASARQDPGIVSVGRNIIRQIDRYAQNKAKGLPVAEEEAVLREIAAFLASLPNERKDLYRSVLIDLLEGCEPPKLISALEEREAILRESVMKSGKQVLLVGPAQKNPKWDRKPGE